MAGAQEGGNVRHGHGKVLTSPLPEPLLAAYLEDLSEALVKAVLYNNVPRARLALCRGANPESMDETHTPVLHLALERCDDDMIQLLLKAGANPHNIDPSCRSALILAQRMGRRDAARMMASQ